MPVEGAARTDAVFERPRAERENHAKNDTLRLIAWTPHRQYKIPGACLGIESVNRKCSSLSESKSKNVLLTASNHAGILKANTTAT